jgi:hypothetical protein
MRTPWRPLSTILLVFAAIAAVTTPAQAQDSGDREWNPHKNGHTFSPVSGVPDAFVRSYIRNGIGMSQTYDIDIPLGIVGQDTLFASRGSLVFANLSLEYQQTIKDWIAFRAELTGHRHIGASVLRRVGNHGVRARVADPATGDGSGLHVPQLRREEHELHDDQHQGLR